MLDGAGAWRIIWNILFPLVGSGIVATSVFAFIAAWNDSVIAYTFMPEQSRYTLPVWLASFSTQQTGIDYSGLMAASVVFSLPVMVFFLLVQRSLVRGVAAGATEG